MDNKFDIDTGADTHLLNETFHVFSKSPGSPTTTLGGARLKSGHTTTSSDVWSDEIPAFFKAYTQDKFNQFQSKAVVDDLCLFNGKVYKHNGTSFVELGSVDTVLVDGATFSKNGKAVVKYHKDRTAINLTADNNNGDASNNYTAKIYNAASGSTTFVPQFISAMDKMVDGIPSLAYDAVVSDSTGPLAEGLTNANDYICNAYAGVIQFNKARESGITVCAWEYIGKKLTSTLSTIATDINAINQQLGNGTTGTNTIGKRLENAESAIKTLTGNSTVTATDTAVMTVTGDAYVGATKSGTGVTLATDIGQIDRAISEINDGYIMVAATTPATTSKKGTVQVKTGEVAKDATDTQSIPYIVPTVGALAATRAAIENRITELHKAGVSYVVADSLPTVSAGTESTYNGKIYLVTTGASGETAADGSRIEYMYVNKGTESSPSWGWERIGTTTADLSGYAKTIQVNSKTYSVSSNNKIDLGSVVKDFWNSMSSNVPNVSSVIVGDPEYGKEGAGTFYIGVANATPQTKGLVWLTSDITSGSSAAITSGSIYNLKESLYNKIAADIVNGADAIPFNHKLYNQTATQASLGNSYQHIYTAPSANGYGYLVVATASPTKRGISYLYDRTTQTLGTSTSGSVTEKTVKAVYDALANQVRQVRNVKITMNGAYKTLANGNINLGNVVTGFRNGNTVSGDDLTVIRTRLESNGVYEFYAAVANATQRGVTYFYNKTPNNLGTASDATVSEKTVKSVYDVLANTIKDYRTNSVHSINGSTGDVKVYAGNNPDERYVSADYKHANLWGLFTQKSWDKYFHIDGFIGKQSTYGDIGSSYDTIAALPAKSYAVEGNFVLNSTGRVIDTIRSERFVSDFHSYHTLASWISDMPNLKSGREAFKNNASLTTFIGDLSSLKDGFAMFYGCSALSTFIGDLSSLTTGSDMFAQCKLNSESVECILDSIPTYSSGSYYLQVGVSTVVTDDSDVRTTVKNITGTALTASVGTGQTIDYKGWDIYFEIIE